MFFPVSAGKFTRTAMIPGLLAQAGPMLECAQFSRTVPMNFEQARFNMVEQQIRPWEVLDQQVLQVILHTPREDYVPAAYRSLAFADTNIPLGQGQVMMIPSVEGRLLQALSLKKTDKVLEIGTGSAYLTACLAALSGHVESVDILPEFTDSASKKLSAHGVANVSLESGDAVGGRRLEKRYAIRRHRHHRLRSGHTRILQKGADGQRPPVRHRRRHVHAHHERVPGHASHR
jgi:hypothetical protein